MLRVETITGLPSSPHVAVKLRLGGVCRVSGLSIPAGWPGLVHPLRSLISTVLPVATTLPLPCHYPEEKHLILLGSLSAVPWEEESAQEAPQVLCPGGASCTVGDRKGGVYLEVHKATVWLPSPRD